MANQYSSQGLRGLLIVLFFGTLCGSATADTIYLKNGQVLEGVAEDRGDFIRVFIRSAHGIEGSIRIERKEIEKIRLDDVAAAAPSGLDLVLLLTGEELAGKTHLSEDGRQVVIDRSGTELVIDHRQVRQIIWAKDREQGEAHVAELAQKLLAIATSTEDDEAKSNARRKLLSLCALVRPYLASKLAVPRTPEQATLTAQVLAAGEIHRILPDNLLRKVPDLPGRAASPVVEERLRALREALVASASDCPRLLLHMAVHDQSPEVRAFVVAQMQLQRAFDELVELLDSPDGSLRFAAALALGDNGVYVGLPLVIEALVHTKLEVREVAISRLEAWTGDFRGYRASDTPAKRHAGLVNWQDWFKNEGQEVVAASLRATIHKDRIGVEAMEEGQGLWTTAMTLWQRLLDQDEPDSPTRARETLRVRYYLEQALARYPHFTNARLALAELLYLEQNDIAGARKQLTILDERYAEDGSGLTRYLVRYHLGRIAHAEENFGEAERLLRSATNAQPGQYRAHLELGLVQYEQALTKLSNQAAMRERLSASIRSLSEALAQLRLVHEELTDAHKVVDSPNAAQPFERGRVVREIDDLRAANRLAQAEVYFLRARALAAARKDKAAARDYTAATKLSPDNPEYAEAARLWQPRSQR